MIRLGERPHPEALVAAGLIVVGLYFASRNARGRSPAKSGLAEREPEARSR